MSDEMKVILELIRNLVTGKENVDIEKLTLDWGEMFSIACKNDIAPFLFNQVVKMNEAETIDQNIMQQWKAYTMQTTLGEYSKNLGLRQILIKAKDVNYSPIIFKGPVLADLYPNYALRSSCDTDFLITSSEKDIIFPIIEQLGYQRKFESEDNVYTFCNNTNGHNLELHTSLYGRHVGSRIDLLKKMNLTNKDTLIQRKICGIEITTLGYVEQLIYLMFHMIKHFTLKGITLRHFTDIVLYINKYIDYISFDRFWKAMDALGYTAFCEVFFSTGIRYMGLRLPIMNSRTLKDAEVCNRLLMDIFDDKANNTEKPQEKAFLELYMVGEVNSEQSNKHMFMHILKPLNSKYEYARKHRILLPICWIHKCAVYIYSKFILKKTTCTRLKKIDVLEGRILLLKQLEL